MRIKTANVNFLSIMFGMILLCGSSNSLADCNFDSCGQSNVCYLQDDNCCYDGWHFLIAPYFWSIAARGTITAQNHTESIHISNSEILKHLDFGIQGHIEAGYGPWTLMVDPTYFKLSDSRRTDLLSPSVTSTFGLIDAGIFYRLFNSTGDCDRFVTFEFLAGARYLGSEHTIEFPHVSFSESDQMVAPIVGGRFKAYLSPRTNIWIRGDVGGFHVDNINSTWSATVGLDYCLTSHIDLGIAYRVLDVDYDKQNSAVDVRVYGPMIGLAFRF